MFTLPVNVDEIDPSITFVPIFYQNLDCVLKICKKDGKYIVEYQAKIGSDSVFFNSFGKAYALAFIKTFSPQNEVLISASEYNYETHSERIINLQNKALSYLMPETAISYYCIVKGVSDLPELCRIFGVCEMALTIRLRNLNLLNLL